MPVTDEQLATEIAKAEQAVNARQQKIRAEQQRLEIDSAELLVEQSAMFTLRRLRDLTPATEPEVVTNG